MAELKSLRRQQVTLLFGAYRKFKFVTGHSALYRNAEYVKHVTVTEVFRIDRNGTR